MPLSKRLRTPGFRWTAAASTAIVVLAALPAVEPGWFVGSSGQVSVFGGVGGALVLSALLLLGWRWVRYVAVAVLALVGATALAWALTNARPEFVLGHVTLAALALVTAGVLALAPPVRSYFDQSKDL